MKMSLVPHLLKFVTGLPLSEGNKIILTVVDLTQGAMVVSNQGAQFYQFSLSTIQCVYEFQLLLFPDQEKKSLCPSVQTFILLSHLDYSLSHQVVNPLHPSTPLTSVALHQGHSAPGGIKEISSQV